MRNNRFDVKFIKAMRAHKDLVDKIMGDIYTLSKVV